MNFKGKAVVGRGRAKTLGFSTINLTVLDKIEIPDGIYTSRVKIIDNEFLCAMHVGTSPTFNDTERTVELHLIGLKEGDVALYHLDRLDDVVIEVTTLKYLRSVLKFNSKEELIKQIEEDVRNVEEFSK